MNYEDYKEIEYNVELIDMPHRCRSFVTPALDDSGWTVYMIYINARMSPDMQRRAFMHEIEHIAGHDFDSRGSVSQIEHDRHDDY